MSHQFTPVLVLHYIVFVQTLNLFSNKLCVIQAHGLTCLTTKRISLSCAPGHRPTLNNRWTSQRKAFQYLSEALVLHTSQLTTSTQSKSTTPSMFPTCPPASTQYQNIYDTKAALNLRKTVNSSFLFLPLS